MMWKISLVIEISCQNEILFDPRWWSKTICVDHFHFKTERESSRFVYSSGLTHLRENYFSLFFLRCHIFFYLISTYFCRQRAEKNKQIYPSTFLFRKRNSRMRQVREEESGWFKLTLKSQENQDADNRKMNSYLHRIGNYFNRSYRQTSHTNNNKTQRLTLKFKKMLSTHNFF